MNSYERGQVYSAALGTWGREAQMVVAIEECSELIKALTRLIRYGANEVLRQEAVYELADVSIMVDQLIPMLGEEDFERFKNYKLERLKERIANAPQPESGKA